MLIASWLTVAIVVAVIEAVVIAWLVRPRREPQPGETIDRLHRAIYGRGRT